MTQELRQYHTRRGAVFSLPLFLPVFQVREGEHVFAPWPPDEGPPIEGCIVNAFFLYKQADLRKRFEAGLTLQQYLGFDGLVTTDSGAFQNFTRPVLVSNRKIVRFQDRIRTDVAAPLDLVTPPGDSRREAERKLAATLKRIAEGMNLVEHAHLAAVQQGGRYLDLRRRSNEGLASLAPDYVAIGSLVPFFNRNHDLSFVAPVIREARETLGPAVPMHIYGAGDPVELPFFAALGADIFDSSSYGHYAEGGWYMTPFGALDRPERIAAGEYACPCPFCRGVPDPAARFADKALLRRHNLWTICTVVAELRRTIAAGRLEARLAEILEVHQRWFPDSALQRTWTDAMEPGPGSS